MELFFDVEHPDRGRPEPYQNWFWVLAIDGDKKIYRAITPEHKNDPTAMNWYFKKEFERYDPEKEEIKNKEWTEAKDYFATVTETQITAWIGIVDAENNKN